MLPWYIRLSHVIWWAMVETHFIKLQHRTTCVILILRRSLYYFGLFISTVYLSINCQYMLLQSNVARRPSNTGVGGHCSWAQLVKCQRKKKKKNLWCRYLCSCPCFPPDQVTPSCKHGFNFSETSNGFIQIWICDIFKNSHKCLRYMP